MRASSWLWRLLLLLLVVITPHPPLWGPSTAHAAPGLCVGPVCGEAISRNPALPWQLRLRVEDQRGQHERLVVDCRDGVVSPRSGPVERGYAGAVARRACRLAALPSAPSEPPVSSRRDSP